MFNDQPTFIYEFISYLSTPKQIIKFFTSSKLLLSDLKHINTITNNLETLFYTPKNYHELKFAINIWFDNNENAMELYNHISSWNIIKITDISELFMYKYWFNDDISEWNTSNIAHMDYMFYQCELFNRPIGKWNLSNIKTMRFMLYNAKKFNTDLNNWTISNNTNVSYIFSGTKIDKKNYWKLLNIIENYICD
jgi:hypothetical protein